MKSMKKDRTGTSPLKENGLLVSDSKSNAEILSRQYKSVFSQETEDNIPEPVLASLIPVKTSSQLVL